MLVKLDGVRDFYSLKPKRNVFGQEKMWPELTKYTIGAILPSHRLTLFFYFYKTIVGHLV